PVPAGGRRGHTARAPHRGRWSRLAGRTRRRQGLATGIGVVNAEVDVTVERGNTARTWRFRRPSSWINAGGAACSSAPRILPAACRPATSWRRCIRSWPSREQEESDNNHEESNKNHGRGETENVVSHDDLSAED